MPRTPAKPTIMSVSAGGNLTKPPGCVFKVKIDEFYDADAVDPGTAYLLKLGYDRQDALSHSSLIGASPLNTTQFSHAGVAPVVQIVDPHPEEWMGQMATVGLARRATYTIPGTVTSEYAYREFYYPLYDEPVYEKSTSTLTAGGGIFFWTQSYSFHNTGEHTEKDDSFKIGDFFIKAKSFDGLAHNFVVVFSFIEPTAFTDTPFHSGEPLFFSEAAYSAKTYNTSPDIENASDITKFVDKWIVRPYTFTSGQHYVTLIGNLLVKEKDDIIRFRLASASEGGTDADEFKCYLHVFMDGEYLPTNKLFFGRGYNPTTDDSLDAVNYTNGFTIGDNVHQVSTLALTVQNSALKLIGARSLDVTEWDISQATEYTQIPTLESGCSDAE